MARKNVWRDTGRTVRFFFFDAKAGIPFLFFLAHIAWWTLAVSVVSFLTFGILERFGFSWMVAFRLVRSTLAGPIRYAVTWWDKPQRKSFY